MAVAEVEAQAEAGAAFSARMNREGSFVFAPAYWANESSGGAGLAGLADFDDCDSHAPEMRTSMDLPAGIHSGNVPVDAIDLMWGGRGLGSGLAGSAEEIEAVRHGPWPSRLLSPP